MDSMAASIGYLLGDLVTFLDVLAAEEKLVPSQASNSFLL